jgi:O-antigen/teichoic acid export membrane protein
LYIRLKKITQEAINNQGFMRYFTNTSWMFGEQMLRMISGVFVGIWVARYLGPTQFGIFSYATAFVAIFSSIAKLGLDGILVRDLVNEPDKRDIYLGTAFWLKIIGAVLIFLVIVAVVAFTKNNTTTNIYILIIASGIVFQSFEVVDFYFQSKVLSKFVSISKITQLILSSLLKVYLVLSGADLFWFVLISLFDQVTLAITLSIVYKYQRIGNFYCSFNKNLAKGLLKDSWPLIFSGLVIAIYMRIDQIMIKEMLGEKEVGIYSAAVRLSEVWYFVPIIITNSIFPAILSAKNNDLELYYNRLQRLYNFSVWLAILIAVPISIISNWLVVFLYGEAYAKSGSVLAIHIWTGVFVFLGVASSSWLTSENLQKFAFYRTLAGAIVNVLLNIILIPECGIVGAAIATLVAQLLATFVFDLLTVTTRKTFFMKLNAFNLFKIFRRNTCVKASA